jgi:hypothetical protein
MADLKIRAAHIAKQAQKAIARHTKQAMPPEETMQGVYETGLKRYPEFKPLVDKLVHAVCRQINAEANAIKSEMPYKAQFTLEEVIRELKERV